MESRSTSSCLAYSGLESVDDTDGWPTQTFCFWGRKSTRSLPHVSGLWHKGGRVPSYQVKSKVSKPGHGRGKGYSSATFPDTEERSTQPSTTRDPTKSLEFGQSDTIVGREYRVGRWKRGRGRIVTGLERGADLESSG